VKLPFLGQSVQVAGGVLRLAVLDELPDQLLARVVWLRAGRVVGPGQEELALQLDQGGGQDEELAGPLHVESLDGVQVVEELLGDPGDGDVADVDLVALDEVQEQVERAVEGVECDLVDHP
jgi:hypothetical protein